jgi:hypothetical protein
MISGYVGAPYLGSGRRGHREELHVLKKRQRQRYKNLLWPPAL